MPASARAAAVDAFYGPLAASPDAARRVGWDHGAAHRLRLAAIAQAIDPLLRTSVLDAGAGEGALLPVLRGLGFVGSYRGEDILPAMIERARARTSDPLATFAVADAFAQHSGSADADAPGAEAPKAEAVVCSGALNTVFMADHDADVAAAMSALWARAGAVLALDLAVRDRHPEGAGLARADLGRAWAHARTLAPVVVVREDVVPGEALLVLSRSRAPAFQRLEPDPLARARLLVDAEEPGLAAALVAVDPRPEARLIAGRAALAQKEFAGAEAHLDAARAAADPDVAGAAAIVLAQLYFMTGRRDRTVALLSELAHSTASVSDEARAHLVLVYLARRALADAEMVAARIIDPWIRREIDARLAMARGPRTP